MEKFKLYVFYINLILALLGAALFGYYAFYNPEKVYDCYIHAYNMNIPTSCEYAYAQADKLKLNGLDYGELNKNVMPNFSFSTTTLGGVITYNCPDCPACICPICDVCSTTGSTTTTTSTTIALDENYGYKGHVDFKYKKCDPRTINDTYNPCMVINETCCPAYIMIQTDEYDTPDPIKKHYENGTIYWISNLTKVWKYEKKCLGGRLEAISSNSYDEYYTHVLKNCSDIGIYTCRPVCMDPYQYKAMCVNGVCDLVAKW